MVVVVVVVTIDYLTIMNYYDYHQSVLNPYRTGSQGSLDESLQGPL